MKEKQIADIVAADIRTASILNKYGIDFCCGGSKILSNVCKEKKLKVSKIINEIGMLGLSIAKSHHEPRIVYGVTLMTNPENFKTSGMIFMGYNLSKRLTTGAGVSINDWKLAKKPHTKPFVMLMFKPTSYPINFFINQSLFNKDMSFTNVGVRFTLFKITSKNEEAN